MKKFGARQICPTGTKSRRGSQRRTRLSERTGREECRHQKAGVPVGRGTRDIFGSKRAIGAGFRLENDRRFPLRGHVLGDDAPEHIGNASGRIGIDHAHSAIGKALLRGSRAGQCQRRQPRPHDDAKASDIHLVRALP
jgi:hypothetical protein